MDTGIDSAFNASFTDAEEEEAINKEVDEMTRKLEELKKEEKHEGTSLYGELQEIAGISHSCLQAIEWTPDESEDDELTKEVSKTVFDKIFRLTVHIRENLLILNKELNRLT